MTSQLMFSVASSVNGSRRAESASGISSMSEAFDPLPAGDRRTIERVAVLELFHGELPGGHLDVLLLALGVGEAKVDELDLLLLDHLQNIVRRQGHFFLLTEERGRKSLGFEKAGASLQNPCHAPAVASYLMGKGNAPQQFAGPHHSSAARKSSHHDEAARPATSGIAAAPIVRRSCPNRMIDILRRVKSPPMHHGNA